MDNFTRAQLSYDAMLARGDGRGDEPEYDAEVRIGGLLVPAGKTEADVKEDLPKLLQTISAIKFTTEDGETWVEVEGTLEAVTAGEDERESTDLFKALEKLGYEPDSVDVMSYEDAYEGWAL